jgi:hypothetical protein
MKKGKIRKNKNVFKPIPGKFNVKITFSDVFYNDNDYKINSIAWDVVSEWSQWCETEESRKLDPRLKREDRLKELGI